MKRIEMRRNPTMKLAVLFLLLSLLISLLPAVAGAAQSSNAPSHIAGACAECAPGAGTGYSVIGTLRQSQSLPITAVTRPADGAGEAGRRSHGWVTGRRAWCARRRYSRP